jgi:hypothetical protein
MSLTTLTFLTGITSNSDIVEYIFRNFRLQELIKKMIRSSAYDCSCYDLEQYIYLELLQMDNERLLILFESEKLRPFISQMILRQRNNGSFYRTVRIIDKQISDSYKDLTSEEYDYYGDILYIYIKSQTEFLETKSYSDEEVKKILSFTLLDKFLISKRSMRQLSKSLNIPRKTISILINNAKELTMNWWDQEGQFLDFDYVKNKYDK